LLRRGLAAAAAVVVIAGGGILLANARSTSPSLGSGSSGAGARAPAPLSGGAGQVSRRTSFGARLSAPVTVSYRLNGGIATTAAVVSGTNFTGTSLPGLLRRRIASVAGIEPGAAPSGKQSPAPHSLSRIGGVSISSLQGCLSVMARGRRVLVVDIARFLGRPATIVVLKSLTAPDVLDVGIVGPGCSESNLDIIRMLTIPVR
jgi:hypothetical protein